jgi:hypothetical protein
MSNGKREHRNWQQACDKRCYLMCESAALRTMVARLKLAETITENADWRNVTLIQPTASPRGEPSGAELPI